jgi:DNA-binding response OmpR family regulator
VLVVDDDSMVRNIAVRLLEAIGCAVSELEDGAGILEEMARAEAARGPIALVLLDLNLRGTSGLDVCRTLRAGGVRIPVVCVSADAASAGSDFDGALRKPFSMTALRECVERHTRPTAGGGQRST